MASAGSSSTAVAMKPMHFADVAEFMYHSKKDQEAHAALARSQARSSHVDASGNVSAGPPCQGCHTDPDARCQCHQRHGIAWIKHKFRTRLSWSVSMFVLGSLNVLAAWLNYVDLSSEKLQYGLVIGPPTFLMWLILLLFTIISSVLYIPESMNTFSVFLHEHGRPLFPLIYDMTVTLATVHIPLSAINYFISRCRQQYTTMYQTMCGSLSIIFFFVRLVWYAHLEGKLLKLDDKRKIKIGFFMTVSSLYAMSMAFYVMNWRSGPSSALLDENVKNISIYMLKAPFLENEYINRYNVDNVLALQGWSLREPEIVPSVKKITESGSSGVFVTFLCNHNTTFVPFECDRPNTKLLFFFQYSAHEKDSPYGVICYSVAKLYLSDMTRGGLCIATEEDLQDGWRLSYFNTLKESHRSAGGGVSKHVYITHPWDRTCTVPKPWYNPDMDICALYKDFIKAGGKLDKPRGIHTDTIRK